MYYLSHQHESISANNRQNSTSKLSSPAHADDVSLVHGHGRVSTHHECDGVSARRSQAEQPLVECVLGFGEISGVPT